MGVSDMEGMSALIREVSGRIERRVLVGYSFDPEVVAPLLPEGFSPRLVNGRAVVGLCLIKFAGIGPSWLPHQLGLKPESVAHRVGVQWVNAQGEETQGVYVPEHHTSSFMVNQVGGRFFPGVQQLGEFQVEEHDERVRLWMESEGRKVLVDVKPTSQWESSLFPSVEEAALFYKPPKGWSPTLDGSQVEGVEMVTDAWNVEAWMPNQVMTTFFDQFPDGSYDYDHTIVMRNLGVRYFAPGVSRPR